MSVAGLITVPLTAAPTPRPTAGQPAGTGTHPGEAFANLGASSVALLVVATLLGIYVLSLVLHPNAKCGRCKGAGRHRGSLFSYATRPCNSCKGRGTHPRLGRKLLFKQPT
ncbi:MAG TPA: hypothetical protein VFT31_01365 [Kribbella sp.]|nr:hypothetical protein [Kribbella sp.]